jgi:NADH-quinone oxidoreductase subunit J
MLVNIYSYLLAFLLISFSIGVIILKNSVFSALSLVMCFIFAAIIWISIEIEFLSIVLILVYVGAVMVLFLFVVMMLNIKHEEQSRKSVWLSYLCLLVFSLIFFYFTFLYFENAIDDFTRTESIISNTREIGIILYTEFTYAFIVAGILLLLAVVGTIAIITPLQEKPEKSVKPKDQMMANKSNRLRLIGDESNDS